MPIVGIGCDVTQISRVARLLGRYGPRFTRRMLHRAEAERLEELGAASERGARFVASRWAAKEAVVKSLGGTRVCFTDVQIGSGGGPADNAGAPAQPVIAWHSAARAHVAARGIASSHVTLSHDGDVAMAVVVLER